MNDLTLGQRIAEQRKHMGMSQEGLGERMGVSRQAISKWESDGAVPEIDKMISLSKLFGVSIGWLLGTEETGGNTESGFSDEQLKTLEQIISRYCTPARQEKHPSPWRWVAVACTAFVLLIAVITLLGINTEVQQHTHQIAGVQSGYAHIQTALGLLSDRLNELSEGEKLLADVNFSAVAWDDRTGADITFRATPKKWQDGDAACISVRLLGQEIERIACQWDGAVCTSMLSLEGSNGYEFYYILEHADGLRQQQILFNTGMEDLAEALQIRCNAWAGEAKISGSKLVLNGVSFNIAAPKIGKAQEELMLKNIDWVLRVNGEDKSRTPLLLQKELGDISNITGNVTGNIEIPLPITKEGDSIELYLDVELSDGSHGTVGVQGYVLTDGKWVATAFPDP